MTDSTQPRFTIWQAMSAAIDLSIKAIEEVRALARIPGPQGDRGPVGPPGKLPAVKEYAGGVSYEGDVVELDGSTYQAIRDTAEEPPHDDWQRIAARGIDGKDAREWTLRGVYDANGEYRALDVVALNGGSFIAIKENPGPIPGEGWRQLCQRGKAGPPGPAGERGERGPEGKAGASLVEIEIQDFDLIHHMSDGTVKVASLRPLFERYHDEAMR